MPLQQGKEALPPERHVTRAPLPRAQRPRASPPEGGVASEPRFRTLTSPAGWHLECGLQSLNAPKEGAIEVSSVLRDSSFERSLAADLSRRLALLASPLCASALSRTSLHVLPMLCLTITNNGATHAHACLCAQRREALV